MRSSQSTAQWRALRALLLLTALLLGGCESSNSSESQAHDGGVDPADVADAVNSEVVDAAPLDREPDVECGEPREVETESFPGVGCAAEYDIPSASLSIPPASCRPPGDCINHVGDGFGLDGFVRYGLDVQDEPFELGEEISADWVGVWRSANGREERETVLIDERGERCPEGMDEADCETTVEETRRRAEMLGWCQPVDRFSQVPTVAVVWRRGSSFGSADDANEVLDALFPLDAPGDVVTYLAANCDSSGVRLRDTGTHVEVIRSQLTNECVPISSTITLSCIEANGEIQQIARRPGVYDECGCI